MSLLFGGATSDRVDWGTGPSVNLTAGTVLSWGYETSTATNQRLFQSGSSAANLRRWQLGGSRFAMSVGRATTLLNVESAASNFSVYATSKWICNAAVFDSAGANGDQKLYMGDLVTPVAEPSSYFAQTVGSGAVGSDAGTSFVVGNSGVANVAWVGRIAWFALWNRVLSLDELVSQQFRPRVTSGCVLFAPLGYNGTGTQPDWSGNGSAGTVTGATVADHVQIPFRHSGSLYVPYTVAAAGGNRRRRVLLGAAA